MKYMEIKSLGGPYYFMENIIKYTDITGFSNLGELYHFWENFIKYTDIAGFSNLGEANFLMEFSLNT